MTSVGTEVARRADQSHDGGRLTLTNSKQTA
jgi:hypothetical protein